jgi:hypothetical protein
MDPPLNRLLYNHLIKYTLQERRILFGRIEFYIRDTTFLKHLLNIDITSDSSIAMNCQLLYGFNNQPGLYDQVTRWFAEAFRV